MQKQITIQVPASGGLGDEVIRHEIALAAGIEPTAVSGYQILKRSIDARGKQPKFQLTVNAFINEPFRERPLQQVVLPDVSKAKSEVLIAGTGPAGLFAAIRLIELGIKPVLIERGKNVRDRRRDLARLNKEAVVNPDSNYCFGEGGAGTYSDGKLYTRSTKRGDVTRILNILVQFGAPVNILYDAHPHIGTNKLPHIITSIREAITRCGGEIHFDKKLTGIDLNEAALQGIRTADGEYRPARSLILATGHSARDIFHLLAHLGIAIYFKPFALGVRVEHPQLLIDNIQYHCTTRGANLPPASYSLVQQVGGHGVFSFCMCPGGIIAPAVTNPGEIVVNGWSPSKRNNPFANSGIVVAADKEDIIKHMKKNEPGLYKQMMAPGNDAFTGLYLQEAVEQKAFAAGGGGLVAPAQRMADFIKGKLSANLPDCSYLPGVHSSNLKEVLPHFVYEALAHAFPAFGKKMRGYFTNDALLVATESRTSSPVRIPRNAATLEHPQVKGLYPCGEGAGYAGGIVSAAMDGERVANAIASRLS